MGLRTLFPDVRLERIQGLPGINTGRFNVVAHGEPCPWQIRRQQGSESWLVEKDSEDLGWVEVPGLWDAVSIVLEHETQLMNNAARECQEIAAIIRGVL